MEDQVSSGEHVCWYSLLVLCNFNVLVLLSFCVAGSLLMFNLATDKDSASSTATGCEALH